VERQVREARCQSGHRFPRHVAGVSYAPGGDFRRLDPCGERPVLTFTPLALGYAIALAIGLPLLAFRTGLREEHVAEVTKARSAVYFSAAVSIGVLAAVTFGISAWQGISPDAVGWKVETAGLAFVWAIGAAVAGLATVWLVVRAGQVLKLPESRLSFVLMPRTSAEKRAFLLVAAVAAVGEEYLYRGFMYHVFADSLGGVWIAATAASALDGSSSSTSS